MAPFNSSVVRDGVCLLPEKEGHGYICKSRQVLGGAAPTIDPRACDPEHCGDRIAYEKKYCKSGVAV